MGNFGRLEVEWEEVACWNIIATVSLKRVKIHVEEKLLWRAYRNSPTLFRTVPVPYAVRPFPRLEIRNPHPKLQSLCIMANIVVNELLCFIQNYYSIVAKANIIAVGSTFFEVGEIVDAKTTLFNFAEEFDSVSARCVVRRASDNKRRLDFEDIIGLWGQLDEQKVLLPTYVAANLKRLPRIDPTEADLCVIAARLHIDTKEQDIIEMLHNAGADKVQCYRVKPKDGKVYQTAAFRVSCDPQSAAIFYNESNWPLGCELRDWIFYKK